MPHMPHPDRCFSPEPSRRAVARRIYTEVARLPLVCPHGHVDPRLFSDPDYRFGSPADLFIIPDHYVFRMLYSQGVPLENLGIPRLDGAPVERDHRAIWRRFAEHYSLFRGTPTGLWLDQELAEVFGIEEPLNAGTADRIYDRVAEQLEKPQFRPRALFDKFGIEVLATTDSASDSLEHHHAIRESGWAGKIIPTFRPDAVVNLDAPNWRANLAALEAAADRAIASAADLLEVLRQRRAYFQSMGATATDHGAFRANTERLSPAEADGIFWRALSGSLEPGDAARFTAHMLHEMAAMSVEDGLVMQLHVGSYRNHNPGLFGRFGPDKGADIPVAAAFTEPLRPLLSRFGDHADFTLILFTLDESVYSRELAPLAGHYPALRLGPPWWFFDSRLGMRRYLDAVVETAGIKNLAGFNDDTRAFCSIPARHDVWRRVVSDWLAGLVVEHLITEDDAREMAVDLAYRLAKAAYRL